MARLSGCWWPHSGRGATRAPSRSCFATATPCAPPATCAGGGPFGNRHGAWSTSCFAPGEILEKKNKGH
eukprot:2257770-Lingulodinium_polyedra.AAC.1